MTAGQWGTWALQGVVKRFFNEKEVTSTLVMDALVSGVKQIEEYSRLAVSKKVLHRLQSIPAHHKPRPSGCSGLCAAACSERRCA